MRKNTQLKRVSFLSKITDFLYFLNCHSKVNLHIKNNNNKINYNFVYYSYLKNYKNMLL